LNDSNIKVPNIYNTNIVLHDLERNESKKSHMGDYNDYYRFLKAGLK